MGLGILFLCCFIEYSCKVPPNILTMLGGVIVSQRREVVRMQREITVDIFLTSEEEKEIEREVRETGLKNTGEIKIVVVKGSINPLLLGILDSFEGLSKIKKRIIEEKVARMFFRIGVDKTRDRTGVLIMIWYAEKRVVIKADRAIEEKIVPGIWDEIDDTIVNAINKEKPDEGIERAGKQARDILEKYFPVKESDTDK